MNGGDDTGEYSAGSDEADEFAAAVGRAMISWQFVEQEAAVLYSNVLNATNGMGAIASFYLVKSCTTRIEMLDAAFRLRLRVEELPGEIEWATLLPRLRAASTLRNRIAHSSVNEEMGPDRFDFWLGPHIFDWSRADFRTEAGLLKHASYHKDKRLFWADLRAADAEFASIANCLSSIGDILTGSADHQF